MLISVPLADGSQATLCGSHALVYRRGGEQSPSVAELRAKLCEKRAARDRRARADRSIGEVDDLGAQLTAAFAGERRDANDRRAG
jgi:hypothetical protein